MLLTRECCDGTDRGVLVLWYLFASVDGMVLTRELCWDCT
jgi:hypothetical protein